MVSDFKEGDGWCTTQNVGQSCVLLCVMLLVHFLSPNANVLGQMLVDVFPMRMWVHTNSCETESPAPVIVTGI